MRAPMCGLPAREKEADGGRFEPGKTGSRPRSRRGAASRSGDLVDKQHALDARAPSTAKMDFKRARLGDEIAHGIAHQLLFKAARIGGCNG